MTTAIVLSGGQGGRLRPLTLDTPKGLVKVAGKPILQHIIEWLREGGVSEIVIGVAYLKEQIIAAFGSGATFGVKILYSLHTVEGGTAEGLRLAMSHVRDRDFLAMNGDQITDLNLRLFMNMHLSDRDVLGTIAVMHPRLPFGLVDVDKDWYCKAFTEKPVMTNMFCSTGIYVFNHDIGKYLPDRGDLEETTFPRLARERRLQVFPHSGFFRTINTLKELEEAEAQLQLRHRKHRVENLSKS